MSRKLSSRPYLLRASGWTKESLDAAELRQSKCCAICGKMSEVLCGDHAHTDPPIPRGLLCRTCNLGLGFFGDNPKLLITAAEYLRMYEPEIDTQRPVLSKHGNSLEDVDGVYLPD